MAQAHAGIELDMIDPVMQVWYSPSKRYPGEEAALGVVFKVVLPRFQFQNNQWLVLLRALYNFDYPYYW